jgi:hypothetical protein
MLWSPNTQLHYPFQNTAKDYSGNARDGTVNGSGVYATKPNGGRCLYFDGVGDYVATPSFGLNPAHTVVVFAADVRCKFNATKYQTLIGDNALSTTVGWLWCRRDANTNNLLWFYASGMALSSTATNYFASPYDDEWLFCVVVCDYAGKKTYFYRQGIPFGSPVAMSGTPVFPSTDRVKYVGSYNTTTHLLTDSYLANVQLWTLPTMPPAAQMLANANRLMLGMHPIW